MWLVLFRSLAVFALAWAGWHYDPLPGQPLAGAALGVVAALAIIGLEARLHRVPAHNMVGAVNAGWKVITDALAAERVMIGAVRMAGIERAFDHLTQYLKTAVVGGKALRNDPVIRDRIGALAADIEVARQFQLRNARLMEAGLVPIHEAAMGKVFASELQERLGQAALDILGSGATLSADAPGAPVGEMEQLLRHAIMGMIGGGTNEIQRSIIAQRGLDLPRPKSD